MVSPQTDTSDYADFKVRVLRRTGIDLNLYKQNQMHRRIWSMVERSRSANFAGYFDLLERDQREYSAFIDRLTINVSEFFRNPDKWLELRKAILPGILRTRNRLRIWSAGCSFGAEAYSLAILMARYWPTSEYSVLATDIDAGVLARARIGRFQAQDLCNVDAASLHYFVTAVRDPHEPAQGRECSSLQYNVAADIRSRVQFEEHNLLADSFEKGLDLICCRNVIIYFTDTAKDQLFERFYNALSPGGVLFLGATERIIQYQQLGFECPAPGFYQRPR